MIFSNFIFDGFLNVDIPGKKVKNAFSIPRKSIYNEKYVYRIKNGKLDFVELETARKEKNSFLVIGGVENGDTLVTEVLQGVSEGMLAEPIFN